MDILKNQQIFEEAHLAGMKAVEELKVEPMVLFDPRSGQKWVIDDGPCGFAWVVIRPAKCEFARYMRERGLAHKHESPGVMYWIGDFNQSMQKKEAYASAFAKTLKEKGIEAYSASRMD